jgi:hypothetical protein
MCEGGVVVGGEAPHSCIQPRIHPSSSRSSYSKRLDGSVSRDLIKYVSLDTETEAVVGVDTVTWVLMGAIV